MQYIKELIRKFKNRFNIKLSDATISVLGIVVLVVVLIGGMVLYNATQNQPLFSFFGREIIGDDIFEDDDEDEEEKDKNKDEDKDDSSNNENGEIHFEEENNSSNSESENSNGGLTVAPSEDDKESDGDNSNEDNDDDYGMFF